MKQMKENMNVFWIIIMHMFFYIHLSNCQILNTDIAYILPVLTSLQIRIEDDSCEWVQSMIQTRNHCCSFFTKTGLNVIIVAMQQRFNVHPYSYYYMCTSYTTMFIHSLQKTCFILALSNNLIFTAKELQV